MSPIFLAMLRGMQNLSSQARDRNHAPAAEVRLWEVGSGLPGLILLLCSANIPLSRFITVCLYVDLSRSILAASKFWQLWIKQLETLVCGFLCGPMFLIHLGKYCGAGLQDDKSIAFPFIYLFYFWLCWVWAFSSCSRWGLLSNCGVQASHFSGFCWGAQALSFAGFSSCGTQA